MTFTQLNDMHAITNALDDEDLTGELAHDFLLTDEAQHFVELQTKDSRDDVRPIMRLLPIHQLPQDGRVVWIARHCYEAGDKIARYRTHNHTALSTQLINADADVHAVIVTVAVDKRPHAQ